MIWIGFTLLCLAAGALMTLVCMASSLHGRRNPYETPLTDD